MPTLTPDDWREEPPGWTNGEKLVVIAWNVFVIVLVLVVGWLESRF
jgi:hypothetical protein